MKYPTNGSCSQCGHLLTLLDSNGHCTSRDCNCKQPVIPLSLREYEVLKCLAFGQLEKQIAWTLGVTLKTIRAHVYNLHKKTGASSRSELVFGAIRSGIIDVSDLPRFPVFVTLTNKRRPLTLIA